MASPLQRARGTHPKRALYPSLSAQLIKRLATIQQMGGRSGTQGFTLVELMVVTVIVGILAAIAIPNFISQTEKAKITEAKQTISAINKQAHADYQEDPSLIAAGATSASILTNYKAPADNTTKFNYAVTTQPAADGSTNMFAVTATANAKFGKPSVTPATITGCVNLLTGVMDVRKNFSTPQPTCN